MHATIGPREGDVRPSGAAPSARADGPVRDDSHRVHPEQRVRLAEPDGADVDVMGHR